MTVDKDYSELKEIFKEIKHQMAVYREFKENYNKQMAFDFNVLNFFNINENKTSALLAFLLNPKESHGQGRAFLDAFLNFFDIKNLDVDNVDVVIEKPIESKRRIDLYIRFRASGFIVAIENKIWAEDQEKQLLDYSEFLENDTGGNYMLFYLSPYGKEPSEESIPKDVFDRLCKENKLRSIGYVKDILPLLSIWVSVCDADNVNYFIKQFQQYLKVKFLGSQTVKINKIMKDRIISNIEEVSKLVCVYESLRSEKLKVFKNVVNLLRKENLLSGLSDNMISVRAVGPFQYKGSEVFKYSISKGVNTIWVQLIARDVRLFTSYYIELGSEEKFINEIAPSFIKDNCLGEISVNEIVEAVKDLVKKAHACVVNYPK